MNTLKFEAKLYLEGIQIPFKSITITNGQTCSASIELAFPSPSILKFKPKTLIHVFIHHNDKWRIFFQGKLSLVQITDSMNYLYATSLFSELQQVKLTPLDLEHTAYEYSTIMLHGINAEHIYKDAAEPELVLSTFEGIEYFNLRNLQSSEDVPTYIKNLLDAAKILSPWYRIIDDTLHLNSSYYVLNNTNIFPVTRFKTIEQLITDTVTHISTEIDYNTILNFLLKQLRYERYELNTPVKINDEWKWIFLLPDTSWVEPFEQMTVEKKDLTAFSFNEDLEQPTRVIMIPQFSNIEMNQLNDYDLSVFYTKGMEQPYKVVGDRYAIAFTTEEKHSGVRPYFVNFSSEENIYSVLDWSKISLNKIDTLTNKELIEQDISKVAIYQSQIAEQKYYDLISTSIQTNYVPVYTATFFPLFPIEIKIEDTLEFITKPNSIIYTFNADGVATIDIGIGKNRPSEYTVSGLNWDPDEYKNIKEYYKLFDYSELMTEEEYWISINALVKSWRQANNIDPTYIAQLDPSVDLQKEYLITPFVKERALPIASYFKDIFDIELELTDAKDIDMTQESIVPLEFTIYKTKSPTTGKTKSKTTNSGLSSHNQTSAVSSFDQYRSSVIQGLKEAVEYLSPLDGKITYNSLDNVQTVLNKLQNDTDFQEKFAFWVMRESSWNPRAVNKESFDYGLFQVNKQHNGQRLTLTGITDTNAEDFIQLSVQEQVRRIALLSNNFNATKILSLGIAAQTGTYTIWYL